MGKNKVKPNNKKIAALITYALALVCLILGLVLPLGNNTEVTGAGSIMVVQLPRALGILLNKNWGANNAFTYSYTVSFFGTKAFDLGVILVLLYTLFTAMGIFALIPALISKKASTSIKAASFIEAIALIPLAALMIIHLEAKIGLAGQLTSFKWCYALIIAFGGTLLFLIVQSFIFKKGSGLVKFLLLLLSAVAVFLMFPVSSLIPKLSQIFGGKLATGIYSDQGGEGLAYVLMMFLSNPFKTDAFTMLDAKQKTMFIATLILGSLVFINFVLDMIGLAKRTNKAMLITNVIRYALETIAVIIVIVMAFLIDGYSVKLLGYVLAGVVLLAFIINIIRLVAYKSGKKKAAKKAKKQQAAPAVIAYSAPATVSATDGTTASSTAASDKKTDKKAEKRAAKQAAKDAKAAEKAAARDAKNAEAAAKQAEKDAKEAERAASFAPLASRKEKEETVYNVETLYNGPTDDFIKKLSNAEKIEFAQVFLERSKVALNNVPDYVVGGNNSKFFSQVFIYYGRIRDYVSDGLMNRLYEEARMMD